MYFLYLILTIIFLPALLVAFGLFFKVDKGVRYFDDGTSTQQYDLPQCLLWLTNPKDGLTGDHRGWYWNTYMIGKSSWVKMWWWSAFRNPWNYLKRHIIGINVKNYTITKVCGQDHVRDDLNSTGFQILRAGWRPALYWVKQWGNSNRAIVLQIGWKLHLKHNDIIDDKWVGITFEPNPYKDIS